ncbi:MAG: Tab2/Atab2 family RNA-binding protein [Oscillatoriophycideae cyanobacterium NC_groundwater_1537_Pr4_S-0.65um_50_18]|nr:Tab2/Atab2 family RNA-binding protein [Oscillatoriophycideae cyanobacterium NC_groundwater_1537_Pr4_S-0.65um_50_18]
MNIWQADFYRRPLQDEAGKPLWELTICKANGTLILAVLCPQTQANVSWLTQELRSLLTSQIPDRIQVFRPQSATLLQAACQPLNIVVEVTRHTPALKQLLQEKWHGNRALPDDATAPYNPIKLDLPPPIPMPENLWGEKWRFGGIAAQNLIPAFQDRPIPILKIPEFLCPSNFDIPPTTLIPGVIIDAGRKSMQLAQWIEQVNPAELQYVPGNPQGLILEAGLVDRWILNTFTNEEITPSAQTFQQRKNDAQGLHFLLVQPDNSGLTYTGFWLLQTEKFHRPSNI